MTPAKTIAEIRAVRFFSNFTDEQIRNHVRDNAVALRGMEQRAKKTGKKVGGYTAATLNEYATNYENML